MQPWVQVECRSFFRHLLWWTDSGRGVLSGLLGAKPTDQHQGHPLLPGTGTDAGGPQIELLPSLLTSRKIDMPLDSCREELSSSEELLEDGDVSRESSILGSPGSRGRERGWAAHELGQGRGRAAASPQRTAPAAGLDPRCRLRAPPSVSGLALPSPSPASALPRALTRAALLLRLTAPGRSPPCAWPRAEPLPGERTLTPTPHCHRPPRSPCSPPCCEGGVSPVRRGKWKRAVQRSQNS